MIKEFKGETVYNQEVDKHFPHLTVGQTLEFAAAVRTPSNRPGGAPRKEFSNFMAKVVMAVLGLSHTYNTKVSPKQGNLAPRMILMSRVGWKRLRAWCFWW